MISILKSFYTVIVVIAVSVCFTGCIFNKTCVNVNRADGTKICLPKCKPIVVYSGNSLKIGKASVVIPNAPTVVIEGVEWDTKTLQNAAELSQRIDLQRITRCEQMIIAAQVLPPSELQARVHKNFDEMIMLEQLSFLIHMNDPKSVESWLAAYGTPRQVSTPQRTPSSDGVVVLSHGRAPLATEWIPKSSARLVPLSSF